MRQALTGGSLGSPLLAAAIKSGAARLAVLPVSAVASLATARIIADATGPRLFGLISLISTLPMLLSFADLGLGASVVNVVANMQYPPDRTSSYVGGAVRMLSTIAFFLICLSLPFGLIGWGDVLGVREGEISNLSLDMVLLLVLFSLSVPTGVGVRILVGADKQHLVVMTQALGPILALVIVLLSQHQRSITGFVLATVSAQLIVAIITCVLAFVTTELKFRRVMHAARVPIPASDKREMLSFAAPMLVVNIGLPIALNSDRLLLSHFGTRGGLSSYAAAAVVYGPIWSVVSSMGVALWPHFSRLRKESSGGDRAYLRALTTFALGAMLVALTIMAVAPHAYPLWAGPIEVPLVLWLGLAVMLIAQASHLPAGMYLMDPQGLRFQAKCVVAMTLVNVPLSVALIGWVGAAGPMFGSAAAVVLCQLLPGYVYIRRLNHDRPVHAQVVKRSAR